MDNALALFICDAIKFVEKFRRPIVENPAQIYISALPLAPSDSLVSQHYLLQYPRTLSVKGGPQTWDELEDKPVRAMKACISLDGTLIAAIFSDKSLRMYHTTTGEMILPPFKADENPRSVIFSQDGKLVASGGQALRLWDVQTGEEVENFDINVYSLALSPDGTCIAAGCAGRSIDRDGRDCRYNIRVINLELAKASYFHAHMFIPSNGEGIKLLKGEVPPSPFKGHENHVNSVAYSADGKQIASSSEDVSVRIWDVSTGESRTFRAHNESKIYSVAFSPDGTKLVSGASLLNLSTDRLTRLPFYRGEEIYSIAFSADSRLLASGSSRAACQIWDASTHHTIVLVGHTDTVSSVAFFRDGKHIMSASEDGTIRVWNIKLLEKGGGKIDGWQMEWDLDGYWIRGPEGEHLFWTPLPFRHARNTLVIGKCMTIDFSNFVYGDDWVKCRKPLRNFFPIV